MTVYSPHHRYLHTHNKIRHNLLSNIEKFSKKAMMTSRFKNSDLNQQRLNMLLSNTSNMVVSLTSILALLCMY